ncbi:MAG TPA: tRNA uridine-5-carboxymethylaminomethyl(34) synthesis GTPase MnmE, partial [Gammaproteobacteria bacterium]|nr:tRNA uridine-5-carboxymethylaminomethyl(34) synthesis GTPase MnmE [Gammaproteobacteria bacterium]
MTSAEIIVAVATPPGKGGVGIVRLSGQGVAALCTSILGRVPAPRVAGFCRFRDAQGEVIDEGLALFFPAPNSFTGEEVLELHGHGGPVVMDLLLQRCLECGARLAEPGEFSLRAFLNGKLDLAQAEAVADLIESDTAAAARLAVRSLEGEFSARI